MQRKGANVRLTTLLLSACAAVLSAWAVGCGPGDTAAPAPTATPTHTPTLEEPPQGVPPTATAEEPPEDEEGGEGGADERAAPAEGVSPAYDIYVGLTLTGPPCGGYTNSGWLSHLSFDSAFRGVRFRSPDAGLPGISMGGFFQDGSSGALMVEGEGEVSGYDLCPAYDGDVKRACQVTEGPKPFETRLVIEALDALVPVGPEPDELDSGLGLTLAYSTGSAVGGGRVMWWDCEGFFSGGFGGAFGGLDASFSLTWARVMQGEDYSVEFSAATDWGEGQWTLRLVPVGEDDG
jgi:hypothetical protein